MRILGIDPGYDRLGIAIVEKLNGKEIVLHSECFNTQSSLPFNERLLLLGIKMEEIYTKYKPDILSIETLFFTTNQKTAMRVAEARGVILYIATKMKMKIFEATPLQIKIATTGYGKANKKDVMKMVKMLVKIDKDKASDDELDAIAIALTGFAYLRV